MGASSLGRSYLFAEGNTLANFDEYLTLQNPGSSQITVSATYQMGAGQGDPVTASYDIDAGRRLTIYVPDQTGGGKDVSVALTSTSDFLAERPMYFNYQGFGAADWTGGHCVIGAPATAPEWFFAEGATIDNFQEYLCLQNPGSSDASVEITYYVQGSGAQDPKSTTVPANSRITIPVNANAGPGLQLSARIQVTSGPGIIAERPMYFNYNGWTGGHCVVGAAGTATRTLTAIGAIGGTPGVGQILTAGTVAPAGATVTYQWQKAPTAGGVYVSIPGATEGTYKLVALDAGSFIEVVATGTGGYTGTVTSAASTVVIP